MTTTELGELESLLERALPDPRAFMDRVLGQLLDRLAADQNTAERTVVAGFDAAVHERLEDRNVLLAAALGACECWGEDPACPGCGGDGAAAWTDPDPELYGEYVGPATRRLAQPTPRGDGEDTDMKRSRGEPA